MDNPKLLSPSTLAFVGDAVYGVMVRTALAQVNRPAGELHRLSVQLVNANAQFAAVELLLPEFTEEELSVYKRGRNLHTANIPKSANSEHYHAATGLEALFGFLHLAGRQERLEALFGKVWQSYLLNKQE